MTQMNEDNTAANSPAPDTALAQDQTMAEDSPKEMAAPVPGTPDLQIVTMFDPSFGAKIGISRRGGPVDEMIASILYPNLSVLIRDLTSCTAHVNDSALRVAQNRGFNDGVNAVLQKQAQELADKQATDVNSQELQKQVNESSAPAGGVVNVDPALTTKQD